MRPLGAAIFGLGRWGQALVRSAPESLKIVRGVTRTPARAQAFAEVQGFPLGDDMAEALADPAVEAVILATPHSLHAAQIEAAAQAGKHVFVEKPLTLDLASARRAAAACDAAGVALAVGFNRRFLPAYQALEDTDIGLPLHAEAAFCGAFGYDYGPQMWRGQVAENPAGGMAAMGIHMLDCLIHLLGPVARVSAQSRRRVLEAPIDDTTSVALAFASGATGSLTTLMATAPHWRLQLYGSTGWARMPDQQTLDAHPIGGEVTRQAFDPVDSLTAELDGFARAVRGEQAYPVTRAEALAGVAAFEAIARSAADGGAWVEVTATA